VEPTGDTIIYGWRVWRNFVSECCNFVTLNQNIQKVIDRQLDHSHIVSTFQFNYVCY